MGPSRRRRIERLSASDVGNLFTDRPGMPFHVGLLAHLGGPPTSGAMLAKSVAQVVEARLSRVPRLRQRVRWPGFGRGRPFWSDHDGFDIDEHVRHREVAAPGDEAALLRACEELQTELLDRSRPLWQLWVLSGLEGGGAAIFFKLHHAVADGTAAVATMGALLDPVDGAADDDGKAVTWRAAPAPTTWQLIADNVAGRARDLGRMGAYLLHPVESARHLAAVVRAAVTDLMGSRAPRCSLNRLAGPLRSMALLRVPLAGVKAAGHAAGGSVNDVILAAVGGGLRDLFAARGERLHGPVVVSVPMSMRRAGDTSSGNQVSVVLIPVPVDETDDTRLLRRVAETTRQRKQLGRVSGYNVLSSELLPLALRRRIMDAMATSNQRLVNLFVTNVPGPPDRLRLAGRDLLDAYPVAPIAGNVTLDVAVLSYAGELHVVLNADPEANPDLDVMAAGMRATFANLIPTPGEP